MAIGARAAGSHVSLLRAPGKFILRRIANLLCSRHIPDLNSGMRAVKRDLLMPYLHILPDGFSASTTMTMLYLSKRFDTRFIPIVTRKRVGQSAVRMVPDGINTVILIFRVLMMFNPLKLFVPMAIFFTLAGGFYGLCWTLIVERKGFPVGALLITLVGAFSFIFGLLADQISAIRQERYETIDLLFRHRKR